MDDILVGLLWIFLFFGLPELLRKKRRPQEYEYPTFPEDAPATDVVETAPPEFAIVTEAPFIVPPVPGKKKAPPAETVVRLQTFEPVQPQVDEVRRGMLWHLVLSPPAAQQRGWGRNNR